MQRPGENICDLQQVQYFLTLSGHLHSFTGSTGALLAPLWLSHTAAVLCTRVTLCLEAAPCHGGSLQPWYSAGVWVKKHCVLLPWAGLSHLTRTHTAALPSSQISFLGRDIWATLRLVPRSQGVVPLHWGTLVTCTWVLVSLLCPGGYFSHGCSSKNSDIIQQRNLFSGWFYASRDQCCSHSSQCRVLLNLHQFRNHQWALGGEEGNNTQRFPLLAWAESSSSPEQCHSADAPAAFSHRRGFPLEPCSRMLMAPQEG